MSMVSENVHYCLKSKWSSGCRAAVVTAVRNDTSIELHVFYTCADYEVGSDSIMGVRHGRSDEPGTWHWPSECREPEPASVLKLVARAA